MKRKSGFRLGRAPRVRAGTGTALPLCAVLTAHLIASVTPAFAQAPVAPARRPSGGEPSAPAAAGTSAPVDSPASGTTTPVPEPPLDLTLQEAAPNAQAPTSAQAAPSVAEPSNPSVAASPMELPVSRAPQEAGRESRERADSLPGRDGFYFRFSTGLNFVSAQGTGPYGDASVRGHDTGGFALTLGGSLAPGFAVAGTIQDFANTSDFEGGPFARAEIQTDDDRSLEASEAAYADFLFLGLLVDWYPIPTAGFHVGAMAGLTVLGITNNADGSTLFGYGAAGGLLAGYDWSISRNWAIGVELNAVLGSSLDMKNDDSKASDSGYDLTPFAVGLRASIVYF